MIKYCLIGFFLLASIGCEQQEETLAAKKARLDKLKKEQEAIRFEIQDLEKEILDMDSTAIERKRGKLVTTLTANRKKFEHFIEIQGTVESDLNVAISPEMGGEVLAIYVDEGQHVKKGQPLLRLDDDVIEKDIEEINTALSLAKTVYERQQNLWDQNIGSEIQLLEAKNKKESLEKKLAKAQSQRSKLKIVAPVEGTVEDVRIKLGEVASPGRPLLNIVNLEKVKVEADAAETYIGSIYKGEEVLINFPALNIERTAEITAVGNLVNPINRTFKVEVALPNPDKALKANLLAVIKVVDYENDSVIVIPTRLVQYDYDEEYVYVVKNEDGLDKAAKRIIETGKSYGGKTEILSGLSEGDVLIDAGSRDVSDGSLIDIQNNKLTDLY